MKFASLAFLGVILTVGAILVTSYIGAYNFGNRMENRIKSQYEDMENILAQYSLKVAEVAQVPEMYRDDLKEVYTAALEGRYGEGGSQAVLQFIHEQNPNFDSSLYGKVQQVMEAGRNQFQNAQTTLVELKRSYNTGLGSFWRGFWLNLAGYPKIDLDKFKIISSGHAQDSFKTGVDIGIKLRSKE